MLLVIFSLLCVLTDRGLCGLPEDDSKESKSVLLTNYLWEVTMDKSKSVLQEVATLIHIHKQIPSGVKVDREISDEVTDKYSAEDKKIKVDKKI